MRRLAAPLLLALSVTSCRHLAPQPDPLESFARTADSVRVALRIPGLSIAVVRDGKVVLARGLGLADVEAGVPAMPETLYPIGSITKTFTATLMLQLAEEGRLDLDHDVARFVDWEVAPDVRIRHVLSHTSEGVPGTRFSYSSRFNWLDNVVEAATKGSFRALLVERVLARAALSRTLPGEARDDYAESLSGLARPYRIDASDAVVRSKYPPMALHSSSGLSSTVVDLARYSIALDEGRLLSSAALAKAFSPTSSPAGEPFPYGLGWFAELVGGERVVWHGSWWPDAYSGVLVKVPARRLALALLANSDALSSPHGGASTILLYPIANAFLRAFGVGGQELRGTSLVAAALTAAARKDRPKADSLLREALDCCAADLASIGDDDRLRIFTESDDPRVRAIGYEAGRRLVGSFPDDLGIRFNLGMAYGSVRPTLRINGPEADDATRLFSSILESGHAMPRWMEAWSSYLVAERIAEREPTRAKVLAERARATGVDTDGLRGRVAELLRRLP
ncbi:MAG: serine hydrolase domain-containing protein [Gemmatimonadaceae bacterium]